MTGVLRAITMPEILLAFIRIRYSLLTSYPRIKALLQQLDAQNLLLQEDYITAILGFYHEVAKALMDKTHKSTAVITEIVVDILAIMVPISTRRSPARRANATLQPLAASRPELLAVTRQNIRVLSKVIKIFRSVCKNDGLAVDFSICVFFNNSNYLEFLDAGLELCFCFEQVEDCYPACKEMVLQAICALLQNDLEQVILYLPAAHFPRFFAYLADKLREEFLKCDSNSESNFITEDSNLHAIKATLTCVSAFLYREMRVKEHRIVSKLGAFLVALEAAAPSIIALMVSSSLSFSYKSMTASIFSEVVFNLLQPIGQKRPLCIQVATEEIVHRQVAKSKQSPQHLRSMLFDLFRGWSADYLHRVELAEFNQKYFKFISNFAEEAAHCA